MTVSTRNTELSGTNLEARPIPSYVYSQRTPYSNLLFRWGVYEDTNPEPVAFGQVGYFALIRRLVGVMKLERQHRERLAAVSLDPNAQKLLSALDRETSIRWEDLPDRAEGDWSEASRSAALLVGANLCEVSPTRIRLNEYGDKLLAESSPSGRAIPEVAS